MEYIIVKKFNVSELPKNLKFIGRRVQDCFQIPETASYINSLGCVEAGDILYLIEKNEIWEIAIERGAA